MHPSVAEQPKDWDPSQILAGTSKRILWQCKRCSHNWKCKVASRTSSSTKSGCPKCAGRKGKETLQTGINDLQTKFPVIAVQADGWDLSIILPIHEKLMTWKCKLGHSMGSTSYNKNLQRKRLSLLL